MTRDLLERLSQPHTHNKPAPKQDHRDAWALRLALGEMSVLLLGGQRLQPQRAQTAGFTWRYGNLQEALHQLLSHQ